MAAINDGDQGAFLATLTPHATLTDDGNSRSLRDRIDREIFTAHGHMNVEREEEEDGLYLLTRYRNDTRAVMPTFWRFPRDRGQDQPHRHRPSLNLRADIPACDNAILKVKCRPSSHWPGRSELATNRLRVRALRSGRSVSRRLLPDP